MNQSIFDYNVSKQTLNAFLRRCLDAFFVAEKISADSMQSYLHYFSFIFYLSYLYKSFPTIRKIFHFGDVSSYFDNFVVDL